jgi:hypothetical protein
MTNRDDIENPLDRRNRYGRLLDLAFDLSAIVVGLFVLVYYGLSQLGSLSDAEIVLLFTVGYLVLSLAIRVVDAKRTHDKQVAFFAELVDTIENSDADVEVDVEYTWSDIPFPMSLLYHDTTSLSTVRERNDNPAEDDEVESEGEDA